MRLRHARRRKFFRPLPSPHGHLATKSLVTPQPGDGVRDRDRARLFPIKQRRGISGARSSVKSR
jgi:hypothetical protein